MMKNLSIEEMKKIVYEITDGELKGHKVTVYPVTYNEYLNELSNDIKFKLSDGIIRNIEGYNYKGDIFIFLDKIYKCRDSLIWKIFSLAEITYHEVRHTIQSEFDPYSYNGFLRDIDTILRNITPEYYYSNYNSFSYEVGANIYSIQKAKEYIQKKFPSLYKKDVKKIELQEEKCMYHYMIYDAAENMDRFIKAIRKSSDIANKHSLKELCPVLDIFMNSNWTFKNLNEIINHNKFQELDERIVSAIFSCKSFLESINMEQLSNEEIELIHNALNYTNKIYQNQSKSAEQALNRKIIDKRTYLETQSTILNKVKYIAEKNNLIMSRKTKKR